MFSYFLSSVIVGEQAQIDGIRESFISSVGWVSMVSTIESRKYPCRLTGIAQHAIEIDHSVVISAVADPRIEGLPLELILGRPDGERSTG